METPSNRQSARGVDGVCIGPVNQLKKKSFVSIVKQ